MIKSFLLIAAGLQATVASTPYHGLGENHFPKFHFHRDVGSFAVNVAVVIREAPNAASIGRADFYIAVKTPVLNAAGEQIVVARDCEGEEFQQEFNGDGGIDLIFPAYDEPKSCTSRFIDAMNDVIPGIIPDTVIALTYMASDRSLNVEITAPVKMEFLRFDSY